MNSVDIQHEALAQFIRDNPGLRYWEVAIKLGISTSTVTRVARKFNLGRGKRINVRAAQQ